MLDRLIALFRRMFISVGALPFLLVLLIIFFATQNPRFLSEVNILNIAQQGIYLLLISLAQMMVLVSGGFDLSVGANVALTSIGSATIMAGVFGASPDQATLAILGRICGRHCDRYRLRSRERHRRKLSKRQSIHCYAGDCFGIPGPYASDQPGPGGERSPPAICPSNRFRLDPRYTDSSPVVASSYRGSLPADGLVAIWAIRLCDRIQSESRACRWRAHSADAVDHLCHLRRGHRLFVIFVDGTGVGGRAVAWRRVPAAINNGRDTRRMFAAWRPRRRRRSYRWSHFRDRARERHGFDAARIQSSDDYPWVRACHRRAARSRTNQARVCVHGGECTESVRLAVPKPRVGQAPRSGSLIARSIISLSSGSSGATQQYVWNWGQSGSGWRALKTSLTTRPRAGVAIALHQTAGRTSSATASSVLGICTPSAFAVFRLMTSSNFVGCRTGISTGFSPFRILRGHRKCLASDRQPNSASRQPDY